MNSNEEIKQKLLTDFVEIKMLEEIMREKLKDLDAMRFTPATTSPAVERRAMEFLGKRAPDFRQLMKQNKRRMEFLGK